MSARDDALGLVNELLARLAAPGVRELEVKAGSMKVKVSRPVQAADAAERETDGARPAAPVPSRAAATPAARGIEVTAPLTGVFYRSPSPQAPPFVQIGTAVAVGDVVALIEAMKLFNEVRSTVRGTVKRIVAENGQLVRAHQPLFELE